MWLLCAAPAAAVPLPIGPLSDYGNVLNRYGRDRVLSLIHDAQARHGISVSILASWETPSESLDRFGRAVLESWGLASARTLLAVFLRQNDRWQVTVLAGAGTAAAYPGLADRIEAGLHDLVAHDRIEEAMVQLFTLLDAELAPRQDATRSTGHVGRTLLILVFILGIGALAVLIHRRVCPRCGRFLRVREERGFGLYGRRDTVYYCLRCGYTRTRRRGPGGRGR